MTIKFDRVDHSYTLDGRQLTSVTQLCARLRPPFDVEYWSERKAVERGVPIQRILAEWAASRERGHAVHVYIAERLNPHWRHLILKNKLAEMHAFDWLWAELSRTYSVERVEWVIGDAGLGIAGTVDAILRDGQTCHVWDWKTGYRFSDSADQKLFSPFDDLDNCDLINTSLQVSLYRLILERAGLALGDSFIAHLHGRQPAVYTAVDLRDRLAAWLKIR